MALAAGVLLSPFTAIAQQKVKLGLLPFSESLAAVIADKQGYFKEEGVEVEIAKFDSGAIAVPVLQSGRMDIVLSSTVSTFQAIEQGLDEQLPPVSAWKPIGTVYAVLPMYVIVSLPSPA